MALFLWPIQVFCKNNPVELRTSCLYQRQRDFVRFANIQAATFSNINVDAVEVIVQSLPTLIWEIIKSNNNDPY